MAGECRVFYSWQSDLLNATNRGFIQTALEKAAKTIRNDDSIEVEPVIDRDTSGVPGAPDIGTTIFSKIEQASVFVCDVSIINKALGTRPCPNPNVLIELGYAIKALGSARIIMVLNSAFGGPELLPFDLRTKRVLAYHMPEQSDRADARRKLETVLTDALRLILTDVSLQPETTSPALSIAQQAREAIQTSQPNQKSLTRQFMKWLVGELDQLNPKQPGQPMSDDALVEAIEKSVSLTCEFAKICEVVAVSGNSDAAFELYRGFEEILNRYDRPRDFTGSFWRTDYDFYKFIGHQMFVILFSLFIKEEKWDLIADFLNEGIYISDLTDHESGFTHFTFVSQVVELLDYRKQRLKLDRISVHADLLNQLHTETDLANLVPMQQFMDADSFLFFRADLQGEKPSDWSNYWMAWSTLYLNQPPRYLLKAYRKKYALNLLNPLGLSDLETFRKRLSERLPNILNLFRQSAWIRAPFRNFVPSNVGTQ
jgi:hypothetical protein